MKTLLMVSGVFILFLFSAIEVFGQLTITPGAQVSVTGSLQLTLSNTDLVNNGSFSAGTGTVSFTGNAAAAIRGSQATHFNILQVNKSGAGILTLQHAIGIGQQISFSSGLLDLNGFDADMGSTGSLNGEQESSHIIGVNGGMVLITSTLNAPAAVNPGNLGILITSAQNLGNTVVRRGEQSQATSSATGNSILRYYDIQPANNVALNATVRIRYLEGDLNGLDENALLLWEKQTGGEWGSLGEDSHDAGANYVEKTAIPSLGLFTLATAPVPLPVNFTSFDAHCTGNSVLLNWKTAQEVNSHYFSVERSPDGVQWILLGNVAAAGNAAVESDYSFTDNSPAGNEYYRIAEYDLDGKAQFTKVLLTACGIQEPFRIWPNPVDDRLYISMAVAAGEEVSIKLFDGKGALVRLQRASLQPGNNLLSVDVKGIAAGLYYTEIFDNNKLLHVQKLIKK
jgi:hypothetical protein